VLKKCSSQEPLGQLIIQQNLIGNNTWELGIQICPRNALNIWHKTFFGYTCSLIKEYIWQKPGERHRPIGLLVSAYPEVFIVNFTQALLKSGPLSRYSPY